ncbi:MAG TPA: hypothetical protein VMW56_02560 [Candidatus Margulisiibacteriota bacterium]|nr:hypothetical protein [Candidatus Margulisiibacteriota bacterium]
MANRARVTSTRVKSLRAALDEFLRAPSADNGDTNEQLIVHHLGTKGIHEVDAPSFDAVSVRYEKKIRTFEEAFYACWNGKRDWRAFDIDTLRECDDLGALQLPARVEEAIIRDEEQAEREAIMGEVYSEVVFPREEALELPPIELLRRPMPKRRRRRTTMRMSKAARSRTRLAKAYREAKAAYHRAGEALRCSHEKCD